MENTASRGQAVVRISKTLQRGPPLRTLPNDTECADVDGAAVTFVPVPFETQRRRFVIKH